MAITTERAVEILDPTHREQYSDLPDGMEQINEACRMGMEALKKRRPRKPVFNETRFRHRGRLIGECTTLEAAYNCPSCNTTLWKLDENAYCSSCGQALDWSGTHGPHRNVV